MHRISFSVINRCLHSWIESVQYTASYCMYAAEPSGRRRTSFSTAQKMARHHQTITHHTAPQQVLLDHQQATIIVILLCATIYRDPTTPHTSISLQLAPISLPQALHPPPSSNEEPSSVCSRRVRITSVGPAFHLFSFGASVVPTINCSQVCRFEHGNARSYTHQESRWNSHATWIQIP